MGHFGFSYVGLIFLLMLFIPNIIWTRYQPVGYTSNNENKVLLFFEKIGQVCVTCSTYLSDFNIQWTLWINLAFCSIFVMILYELWWIRYFKSEKEK